MTYTFSHPTYCHCAQCAANHREDRLAEILEPDWSPAFYGSVHATCGMQPAKPLPETVHVTASSLFGCAVPSGISPAAWPSHSLSDVARDLVFAELAARPGRATDYSADIDDSDYWRAAFAAFSHSLSRRFFTKA